MIHAAAFGASAARGEVRSARIIRRLEGAAENYFITRRRPRRGFEFPRELSSFPGNRGRGRNLFITFPTVRTRGMHAISARIVARLARVK